MTASETNSLLREATVAILDSIQLDKEVVEMVEADFDRNRHDKPNYGAIASLAESIDRLGADRARRVLKQSYDEGHDSWIILRMDLDQAAH